MAELQQSGLSGLEGVRRPGLDLGSPYFYFLQLSVILPDTLSQHFEISSNKS